MIFLLTDDVLSANELSAFAGGTTVDNVSPGISNQMVHYTWFTNYDGFSSKWSMETEQQQVEQ